MCSLLDYLEGFVTSPETMYENKESFVKVGHFVFRLGSPIPLILKQINVIAIVTKIGSPVTSMMYGQDKKTDRIEMSLRCSQNRHISYATAVRSTSILLPYSFIPTTAVGQIRRTGLIQARFLPLGFVSWCGCLRAT